MSKKQRKYLRHKQVRRDILCNGRQKLPLFRQVFPLLWPEDNTFRPIKIGILSDVEAFINENPGCGLSLHDCRCVLSWVTGRLTYLCLFSTGAVRYDLDGVPSGTVSDRDVFYAGQTTERILRFLPERRLKHNRPLPPLTGTKKMMESSCHNSGMTLAVPAESLLWPCHLNCKDYCSGKNCWGKE
ncbi:hypothetical protein GJY44_18070 [Salmonella enterica]|nr:hypothetical protein [Salmonella enterica]